MQDWAPQLLTEGLTSNPQHSPGTWADAENTKIYRENILGCFIKQQSIKRASVGFGLLNTELGVKSNVKAKTNLLLEVIPTTFYSTAAMRYSEASRGF